MKVRNTLPPGTIKLTHKTAGDMTRVRSFKGPRATSHDSLITTSPSYRARAVAFEIGADRMIGTMTGTDTPLVATSAWVRTDSDLTVLSDPNVLGLWQTENGPFVAIISINTNVAYLYASVQNSDGSAFVQWRSSATVIADTAWHHVIVGMDTTTEDHDDWKVVAYVDRVKIPMRLDDILPEIYPDGVVLGDGPLNASMYDNGLCVPDFAGAPAFPSEIADLFIYTDRSLISGNEITSETLNFFVTEKIKPVDPSHALVNLGRPAVLFSGDEDSFLVNQGSGGGTFTGSLVDAETSPSD